MITIYNMVYMQVEYYIIANEKKSTKIQINRKFFVL
jgi:hypothetical protein